MPLARPVWPEPHPAPAVLKHRMPSQTPSIAGPKDVAQLLALQRLAGNRATSGLLTVQRCGPIPSDECPCNEGSEPGSQNPSEQSAPATTPEQHGPSAVPLQQLEV